MIDVLTTLEGLGLEGTIRGDEFVSTCPMHYKRVGREDANPSWSINVETGLFNCLQGDTGVITWEGTFPIRDLAGGTHRLLTSAGWQDAPVQSFGVQRLWRVELQRNGVKKEIFATQGHRWFAITKNGPGRRRGSSASSPLPPTMGRDGRREFTTDQLLPGYALATVTLPAGRNIKPSPWGIAHGIVYGDGTLAHAAKWSRVTLYGEKDAPLRQYFPLSPATPTHDPSRNVQGVLVDRLPRFFKSFPSLDEPPTYLYGWLAGYFAADGCVDKDGFPSLASAWRTNLEFVQLICNRLGIKTYAIKKQVRLGKGRHPAPLYSLGFVRSTLNESFFLTDVHRERWLAHRSATERQRWVVVSVEPTDRTEEVYCAVVPGTHDFALEDHILTGNCFSCGYRGSVYSLIVDLRGVTFEEAKTLTIRPDIRTTVARIPEAYIKPHKAEPISESRLGRFTIPPRWARNRRKVSKEACELYGVRWDLQSDQWIIPIREPYTNNLMGWQEKAETTRVFRNFPTGVKKSRTLFGYDVFPGGLMVVVESPLDAVRLHSEGITGAVASYGARISRAQIHLMSAADEVVFALDNPFVDDAGKKASIELLTETKGVLKAVRFFDYSDVDAKDPGDMTHDEIERGIQRAKSRAYGERAVL